MTFQLTDQAPLDIANSVLNSPVENSYYFFFSKITPWSEKYAIIATTQTNPVTLQLDPNHKVSVGDTLSFDNVSGMVELNTLSSTVTSVSNDIIELSIDATGFGSYTSGGEVIVSLPTKPELESIEEVKQSIAGLVRVTGDEMVHVIPRNDWQSTKLFDSYDPNENQIGKSFHCFVDDAIFLCVDNAGGIASTVKPNSKLRKPIIYADGYTWQFVQTVSDTDKVKFLTPTLVPVRADATYQTNDKNGLFSIKTISRGTGYKNTDLVTIRGDGEKAFSIIGRFTTGGSIVSIDLQNAGKNYTWCTAYIESNTGTNAILEPVISYGYGYFQDPVQLLRSRHISFSVEIDGSLDGRLYVGDVRSIGVLRKYGNKFNSDVIDTRSILNVDSNGSSFTIGSTITGQISNTKAIVASVSENEVKYLERNGIGFIEGELISDDSVNSAIITKVNEFDSTVFDSSQVIALDNKTTAYTRNNNQVDTFNFTIGY